MWPCTWYSYRRTHPHADPYIEKKYIYNNSHIECGNDKKNVVFRRLVRLGSFPACWRLANVTPISKGPPSSSVANYRPIFITSVLSKVFERLVSVRLGRFMERSGVLPTTQFAYWKGLGTCDALLCVSNTLQSALESGQEARIVQIDFSAAFDMVNHLGILYISSALWVLEVLSCLYWHSFYQTDHSKLWWMVVEVNWLMLYQECRREMFWARYCSSCTVRNFFPFWKISWSVMLITPLWWLLCQPQPSELQQ